MDNKVVISIFLFLHLCIVNISLSQNIDTDQASLDNLEDISYKEVERYSQREIIEKVSKRIFTDSNTTLDLLCIKFSNNLCPKSLSHLLNTYFETENEDIRSQLTHLIFYAHTTNQKEILLQAHNDPRVNNENNHSFFFSTLHPLTDAPNEKIINSILKFMSDQKIVDGDPYALKKLEGIKVTKPFYDILDLKSPYLNSFLGFQIALAVTMGHDSPENTVRIKKILNFAGQQPPKKSVACESLTYLLSGAFYAMTQLGRPINIEAYENADRNKFTPTDTEWNNKFEKQIQTWDVGLNNPKRIKELSQVNAQNNITYEIENAKSRYAISNETSLNSRGFVQVKFEDIKLEISGINGTEYQSLSEMEKTAGREILSLGTYPTEENSFQGDPIVWGKIINK